MCYNPIMLIFDHSGLPKDLVRRFRESFSVDLFIEAGTYQAMTARWAATVFPEVVTIEKAETFYRAAVSYENSSRIRFLLGDSREHLRALVAPGAATAIFWLDAHWSGGETAGEGDECPLLSEIALIAAGGVPQFVLVDDARFFLAPPPAPHRPEQWPTISEVLNALKTLPGDPYIVVFQDVIIAVPEFARELMTEYCQKAYKSGYTFPGQQPPSIFSRVVARIKKYTAASTRTHSSV